MRRNLWRRSTSGRRRVRSCLPLLLSATALLSGCASSPMPPPVQECPEPVPVPAELARSALPDAQACSRGVLRWLEDVRDFLSGLPSTRTRSQKRPG